MGWSSGLELGKCKCRATWNVSEMESMWTWEGTGVRLRDGRGSISKMFET